MARTGRPKKPIDWKLFEQLCHIQCTHDEIANMFHIAKATLYERAIREYKDVDFPTIYKRYSEEGKCSLRRNQFRMSQKNCTMAIWLGKQYLGQKDHEYKTDAPQQANLDAEKRYLLAEYQNMQKEKEIKELKDRLSSILPQANT